MDIAIIGAGIAGLSAAWSLRRAGHRVRVFERNYKPGGRMNSRRKAGLVVDHGDRFILRESPILRELIEECGMASEICPIELPIYTMRDDGSFAESPEQATDAARVTFVQGMLALPEALRRHLGGYYSIGVTAVEWQEDPRKLLVRTEPPLRSQESQVDAVVIATHATEAFAISKPIHHLLHQAFLERLCEIEYDRCFTLIAALAKVELPIPFYGIVPPKTANSTLCWVAFEDMKCQRRAVEGWSVVVAHSTPESAEKYFRMDENESLRKMYAEIRRSIPQLPAEWRWARAKRWDVAHLRSPEKIALFSDYPAAPDRVLVEFCGDFRQGDGVEAAALSGRLAAETLLGKIERLPATV